MKLFKLLVFALTTLCFTACSSDDNDTTTSGKDPETTKIPLTIEVSENPLVNPEAQSQAPATRAAITTTSTLEEFKINYVYKDDSGQLRTNADSNNTHITAKKTEEGKWVAKDGSWPPVEFLIDWYAYSDGAFNDPNDPNDPYISFEVEENSAKQKDLLVAKASVMYSGVGSVIHFTLNHACTALRFYVKKATNLADYTLSITNLQLCNVIKSGQYYYGSDSWTLDDSNRANYTLYSLYSGSGKTLGTTEYEPLDNSDGPYLFMIPQELTPWNGTTDISSATESYIQLTCTITQTSDNRQIYSGPAYIPFGTNLTAGYQHDVKINIGKNSLYSSANTKIIQ